MVCFTSNSKNGGKKLETIKDLIKKPYKDTIDKQILIKKFFKTIYRGIDLEEEQIRLFQNDKDGTYNKVTYFNDIDDLVNFSSSKYNYHNNTYFQLSSTDGVGGSEEHLKYRYCLGFDFDKKDLGADFNHKDIINLFKGIKIYCHCIVDTSNGYHAYIMINKTNDMEMVDEVQKALATKLNADLNAIKTTQILRIPFTYNVKGDKPKGVKLVHLEPYDSDKFKAYDIEFLYQKNCNSKVIKSNKQITYTLNNTNMPKCIENILMNGSADGDRYRDLCNIVVALRLRNKTLGEIKEVCKEWALKSNYDDNLDYRIENIYNNKKGLELDCKECSEVNNCYNKVISDFEFSNDYDVFTLENKLNKQLKNSNRKGAKAMNGNELLIVNVLKNNEDGLYKSEIVKKITFKKKCRLSDKTIIETLKSLEYKGVISVVKANRRLGIESFYTLNPIRAKEEEIINVSYLATAMCICRLITPTELQLYHYMRYLHHKEQKDNSKALKGNLFQINQRELAKAFYGSDKVENQSNISKMINSLLECHILDIWERQPSKNNNFEYYIYRLNS